MEKKKDFYKLFFINEGRSISGKKYKNIISLCCILFVTFVSIGFGEGGLAYLEHKMSDPFINWVSVSLPNLNTDKIKNIKEDVNLDTNKSKFGYNSTSSFREFIQNFKDIKGVEKEYSCRTIESNSPLIHELLSNRFLVEGVDSNNVSNYFNDTKSCGLIVSEDFLDTLGYKDKTPSYINLSYPVTKNNVTYDYNVPLPVIAKVKRLPGMVSVMTTSFLFKQLNYSSDFPFNVSDVKHYKYLKLFIPNTQDGYGKIVDFKAKMEKKWPGIIQTAQADTMNFETFIRGISVYFAFSETYQNDSVNIADSAYKLLNINNSDIVRTYDYAFKTAKDYQDDYISVYFSILDSIKPFQDYMFQKHKLKIEMTQIDAKENFNFMSKLTKITLFILILFCVFSISLFVYNLFTNHLEKIKKNIGTFKAFGLENSVLIRVYTAISFILVSASILIGFGAASLFGYFGGVRVILHIFGVNLESGYLYFDLNTAWSYITILLLILVSTGIVWFKLKQMVKNTPGDLIYERK